MRKKIEAQMNIEDHNFLSLEHVFPKDEELEKMSAVLDEAPEILEAVARDLQVGLKETGAYGMTVEQILRSAIIYQLKGYPYRELAERINDSFNFRKFTRFYATPVPHFTNLEKGIKRIRPETFDKINQLLVDLAIKKKLEDGKSLRADATVVKTNIHHPTDAGLLWDSVRVIDRLIKGAHDHLPQARFEYHNRTRRSKKISCQITMAKGKGAEKKRAQGYRQLLKVAAEVVEMGRSCRAALANSVFNFTEADIASCIADELDHYLPLAEQCIEQCQRRVICDEKVPADEKLVSIFEPHTDIIRRGKSMSPTEFGHKVTAATGKSGLILQHQVSEGNPSDGDYLGDILEKHVEQFGHGPDQFAADRRFYSEENERLASCAPFNVSRVSIPKPGRKDPERTMLEKQGWFKKLQRFRAGIEGILSTLLRGLGFSRCLWCGFESFKSWVGLSVFAWNLRKIAALI